LHSTLGIGSRYWSHPKDGSSIFAGKAEATVAVCSPNGRSSLEN